MTKPGGTSTGLQLAVLASAARAFLVSLCGTGLRRGEALRLALAEMNLPARLSTVRGTKLHHTTRHVPLDPGSHPGHDSEVPTPLTLSTC